jgi:hypothetical protein
MKISCKNIALPAALIFLILSAPGYAQKPDEFHSYIYLQPNIGLTQYFGDLNRFNFHNAHMEFGWGGMAIYQVSPVFGLRSQFMQSNLYSDSWVRNLTLVSKTWDLTAQGTLNISDLIAGKYKAKRILNAFVFGGFGYFYADATVNEREQSSKLRTGANGGLVFPWGAGLSVRISNGIDLDFEYGMHVTASDYKLDLTANKSGNKGRYDMFSYASAGLTFNISGRSINKDDLFLFSELQQPRRTFSP